MYSLTFCVRVMSSERHHWKPAVQAAAVMLRTPPSTASHRPASHAHFPYAVRNFENAPVTRRSPAGIPYHSPKLYPGPCNSVGIRPRTDTQTDTQTRVTTIYFASSHTTHAKCNKLLSTVVTLVSPLIRTLV